MAKRKKSEKVTLGEAAPANNPFAAALAGMTAPLADPADLEASAATETKKPKLKVKTRVDSKGRRGKSVTLVDGLETLSPNEREDIARDLKRALGTGVSIEGATLVVQGELAERIRTWFEKRDL